MLNQKGITLFEIMISVLIFVSIAILANQALFSALRGSNKSQITTKLKQSAEYSFEVMERALRQASNITSACTGSTSTSITYADDTGVTKTMACNNIGTSGYLCHGAGSTCSTTDNRVTTDDIAVTACSFTCTASGSVRTVSIDMTFSQAGTSSNLKLEDRGVYRLKTQVYLRN